MRPQPGYIYIMVNPSLQKDTLKIGMTTRKPEHRATELSGGTAIPTNFSVAYEEYVPDSVLAEKLVHQRLRSIKQTHLGSFCSAPKGGDPVGGGGGQSCKSHRSKATFTVGHSSQLTFPESQTTPPLG